MNLDLDLADKNRIEVEPQTDSNGKESKAAQEYILDDYTGEFVPAEVFEGESRTGCAVCGSWDHWCERCPWMKKLPEEGFKLGVHYDIGCLGCGNIGKVCCAEGGCAVRKCCGSCWGLGHWCFEDSKDCPGFISKK